MELEKKTLRDVNNQERDIYRRALEYANDNRNEFALKLLLELVKKHPGLECARIELRRVEKKMQQKQSFFSKLFGSMGGGKKGKIKPLINGSPLTAMAMCEDELAKNVYDVQVLDMLASAALRLDCDFIALECFELIRETQPNNNGNLQNLFKIYRRMENYEKGCEVATILAKRNPSNIELQAQARTAALQNEKYLESQKSARFRQQHESSLSAVVLQLQDGTIHDERQAKILIDSYSRELKNNDSLDIRRKLAEAYMVSGDYDKAQIELEYVANKLGVLDPVLDKAIEKCCLAKLEKEISTIEAAPHLYENSVAEIARLRNEYEQVKLDRALSRLKRFPNDAQLHYDLGMIYFDRGNYTDAVNEFTVGKENLQRRAMSAYYLGCCLSMTGRYDEAIKEFEASAKDMFRMDKRKLETLYQMADAYEKKGDREQALKIFEEISTARSDFKDVAERIKSLNN